MGSAPGFNTAAYLERIGHRGGVAPTGETLAALHLAHLRAVPFENLDIHLGRPIRLDEGEERAALRDHFGIDLDG